MKQPTSALKLLPQLVMCPDLIWAVIEVIAGEPATKSIWLIGSRANCRAKPDSDWDILVFGAEAVSEVPARILNLDVLRVSPAGDALLEGMTDFFVLAFSRFRWSRVHKDHAEYEGHRFRAANSPRDYSESPIEVSQCRAFLIYEKDEG